MREHESVDPASASIVPIVKVFRFAVFVMAFGVLTIVKERMFA